MFSRIVSLVLIAAVIACPLWCVDGLGLAAACCGNQAETSSCCSGSSCCESAESHTCDLRPGGGQHPDDQPCPCESTDCQGICGGAVLGKSIELDDVDAGFLTAFVDVYAPASAYLSADPLNVEQTHFRSDANHGRSVRTLHMSFLC